MLFPLLLLSACSNLGLTGPGGDSDSDSDSDTDSDTDTDSGAAAPVPGDLVITEIMKDPDAVDDDDGEWFEVQNVSGHRLELEGIELRDADGAGDIVSGSLVVDDGALVLFGAEDDPTKNGGITVDVDYSVSDLRLDNGDDSLGLYASGLLIDEVSYTEADFPDAAGASLSLDPSAATSTANDDASAWCEGANRFGDGDLGTPGTVNPACVDAETDTDGDGVVDAEDCDPADARIYPGAPELADGVDDDCDGHVDERPPEAGELVVVEVMKNPDPTTDDDGEWIELLVVATVPLELDGLELRDEGGDHATLSTDAVVEPGELWVLATSDDPTLNGRFTPDQTYDVADFKLTNDDDEVILELGSTEIDRVDYTDKDFPDDDGASLNLDPAGATSTRNDDGDWWCSATLGYGTDGNLGSPGSLNEGC